MAIITVVTITIILILESVMEVIKGHALGWSTSGKSNGELQLATTCESEIHRLLNNLISWPSF
jgi:hypothetical protein